MTNRNMLLSMLLLIFSYQSNGQSKIIEKSIINYLDKNIAHFQHDTLFIQDNRVSSWVGIPKKVKNVVLFSFDKMPPTYFKNANFVLGIDTKKKGNLIKVTLTERDFEYNTDSKNWVISYNGEWVFHFIKKGNKYLYKKYTHTSI